MGQAPTSHLLTKAYWTGAEQVPWGSVYKGRCPHDKSGCVSKHARQADKICPGFRRLPQSEDCSSGTDHALVIGEGKGRQRRQGQTEGHFNSDV